MPLWGNATGTNRSSHWSQSRQRWWAHCGFEKHRCESQGTRGTSTDKSVINNNTVDLFQKAFFLLLSKSRLNHSWNTWGLVQNWSSHSVLYWLLKSTTVLLPSEGLEELSHPLSHSSPQWHCEPTRGGCNYPQDSEVGGNWLVLRARMKAESHNSQSGLTCPHPTTRSWFCMAQKATDALQVTVQPQSCSW